MILRAASYYYYTLVGVYRPRTSADTPCGHEPKAHRTAGSHVGPLANILTLKIQALQVQVGQICRCGITNL